MLENKIKNPCPGNPESYGPERFQKNWCRQTRDRTQCRSGECLFFRSHSILNRWADFLCWLTEAEGCEGIGQSTSRFRKSTRGMKRSGFIFCLMVLHTEYPHTVNLSNWRQVVPRSPSAPSYPSPDPSTVWPRPCGLGPKVRKMAALRLNEFAVQKSLNLPPRKDVAQGKKKGYLKPRRHNCLAARQSIGPLI